MGSLRVIKGRRQIGMPVDDDTKRIIWIDGGMHARFALGLGLGLLAMRVTGSVGREWAAPHVAAFLIYQLAAKYGRDPLVTNILNAFNFFIAPNVNPDGFPRPLSFLPLDHGECLGELRVFALRHAPCGPPLAEEPEPQRLSPAEPLLLRR